MTDDDEARALRRLLKAAAARPDELPEPSPFLAARVRAAAAGARPHPFGAAARQMLPAMTLLVTVLTAYAGWQSVEAARQKDAAIASLMDPRQGGDLLLTAALLGAATP